MVKVDLYAQTVLSSTEDVCAGELRQYKVEGLAGSTIYWSVEGGAIYNGGSPVADEDATASGIQYSETVVSGESIIGILWNVTAGDYKLTAYEETSSLCVSSDMELTVTVSDLPDQSLSLSDPSICPSGTASILLSNSELGVDYQLRLNSDDSNVGSVVAGTGGTITFAVTPAVTTVYNVYAKGASSDCGVELDDLSTVRVEDLVDPIAICKDITIQLDASGNATITAAQIDNGSSDNCGIASMSLSKTDFNCDDVSTNLVVASTDDYAVSIKVWPISVNPVGTTCEYGYNYKVTVGYDISFSGSNIPSNLYTLQGTLDCGNTYFNLPNGGGSGTVETSQNWRSSSDCATITPEILGCTDASIKINGPGIPDQTISSPLSSPNTIELTVVDNSGNTSTCSANVSVEDNIAPTAICKDITIQLDATGNASIVASDIDGGSSDACGILSMTASMTSFTAANVGENTVTLTVTDNNSNVSTCDAIVTVEDDVAPTAVCQDITIQLDASGNASITALQIDNGSSDASGISDLSVSPSTFSCSNVGPNTVTLTVTDNNGQVSTCTATVTVEDVTDPVTPTLANITGECSATAVAPTTTDVCGGTITGTTSDPLIYTTQGTHVITWNFDDGHGNDIDVIQNVIITDATAPVADLASLPNVTAECEVTSLTAPSATDNCSAVTVTNDASLPITTQGTTVVTWTYKDVVGNTSTQTQNVIITDATAPVADLASLPNVTAECEVTTLTAPSATDNCSAVTVTNDASLPITTQGTTVVTWTYKDVVGNISTQTQNVIITDATAPVADLASLPNVTAECEVTSLTAPTATDNCSAVTVTNDASLPITAQGTTVVTWTYKDVVGNTSTQTQNVIITDATAPVADLASLPNVTAECEVTTLTAPSATDNCSSVTVTNDASLPITAQGTTVVTWTYKDVVGNISTQTQNVIITDATAPVADLASLPNVTAECEVTSLTAPSATDNCSSVTVTNDASLPITAQGTTVVTWTYKDVVGNTSTQTQNVIITDATAPVADLASLPNVTAECEVTTLTAPSATDNCSAVTVTNDASLPITTQGTTVVTWTYKDVVGNISTQTQN
ncbi:hypothetical protein BZG02_19620, partial [Labilibaculum filiforme]